MSTLHFRANLIFLKISSHSQVFCQVYLYWVGYNLPDVFKDKKLLHSLSAVWFLVKDLLACGRTNRSQQQLGWYELALACLTEKLTVAQEIGMLFWLVMN